MKECVKLYWLCESASNRTYVHCNCILIDSLNEHTDWLTDYLTKWLTNYTIFNPLSSSINFIRSTFSNHQSIHIHSSNHIFIHPAIYLFISIQLVIHLPENLLSYSIADIPITVFYFPILYLKKFLLAQFHILPLYFAVVWYSYPVLLFVHDFLATNFNRPTW